MNISIKKICGWGTMWVAQQTLGFSSSYDLMGCEIKLHIGPHTQWGVYLKDSLPVLLPQLTHASLSITSSLK